MRKYVLATLFIAAASPVFGAVPEHSGVVQEVYQRYIAAGGRLDSKEGSGRFTEAVAAELARLDGNWGHLRKSPAQNNFNGHAVDAVLYRATGQAVDIIIAAGDPDARPGWQVDIPRYTDKDWIPAGPAPDPLPPPTPAPDILAELQAIHTHLARIDAQLEGLTSNSGILAEVLQGLREQVTGIAQGVARLEARRPPALQGRVLGFPVTLRPVEE